MPSTRRVVVAPETLVPINCGAMPESIMRERVFSGHPADKGSFMCAVSDKKGLLEEAHRGVLFLDEIGDMSTVAACRVFLQGGEVRASARRRDSATPPGSPRPIAHAGMPRPLRVPSVRSPTRACPAIPGRCAIAAGHFLLRHAHTHPRLHATAGLMRRIDATAQIARRRRTRGPETCGSRCHRAGVESRLGLVHLTEADLPAALTGGATRVQGCRPTRAPSIALTPPRRA